MFKYKLYTLQILLLWSTIVVYTTQTAQAQNSCMLPNDNMTTIGSLITRCFKDIKKKEVVLAYFSQLANADLQDCAARHYIKDYRVRSYISNLIRESISNMSSDCLKIPEIYQKFLTNCTKQVEVFTTTSQCKALIPLRCTINTKRGNLRVRAIPHLHNQPSPRRNTITRIDSFKRGATVQRVQNYKNWSYIQGLGHDGKIHRGWSSERLLRCN